VIALVDGTVERPAENGSSPRIRYSWAPRLSPSRDSKLRFRCGSLTRNGERPLRPAGAAARGLNSSATCHKRTSSASAPTAESSSGKLIKTDDQMTMPREGMIVTRLLVFSKLCGRGTQSAPPAIASCCVFRPPSWRTWNSYEPSFPAHLNVARRDSMGSTCNATKSGWFDSPTFIATGSVERMVRPHSARPRKQGDLLGSRRDRVPLGSPATKVDR
jgi:hypothetical protein